MSRYTNGVSKAILQMKAASGCAYQMLTLPLKLNTIFGSVSVGKLSYNEVWYLSRKISVRFYEDNGAVVNVDVCHGGCTTTRDRWGR